MKKLLVIAFLFALTVAQTATTRTESGCPPGQYQVNGNECRSCSANCMTCTDNTIKGCSACNDKFSKWLGDTIGCIANQIPCKAICDVQSSIVCNGCADGYFPQQDVNKTALGICESCISKIANCLTCSSDTVCTTCVNTFYYDATAKTCKSCIDGCLVCTDGTTCTTCKPGYAKGSDGKCKACGADCAECNAEKTAECSKCNSLAFLNATAKTCKVIAGCLEGADDKCTKCMNGFRLKTDGTCFACAGSNVQLCGSTSDTAENIIACKVGFVYTVAGTTATARVCLAAVGGCAEVNSDGICTKCITNYVLDTGKCVLCGTGIYLGCSTCSDGSATAAGKCTACLASGYYNSGTGSTVTCSACAAGCATCSVSGCSACLSNFYPKTTTGNIDCGACPTGAASCSDNLTATSCLASWVSQPIGICRACNDSNCLTCPKLYTTCTKCKTGYSVVSGACAKCADNCTDDGSGCTSRGAGKCDDGKCKANYSIIQISGTAQHTCGNACAANCQTGASALTNCATAGASSCDDNKCNTGYVKVSGLCLACSSNCSACGTSLQDKCDTCKDGYIVNASKLCDACAPNCKACATALKDKCDTCNDGFIVNATSKLCEACAGNCKACATAGKDKCDTCNDGFIVNATSKLCEACAANCKACATAGKDKCDTCNDAFIVNATSKLCDACADTNCATCTATDNCATCKTGYEKTDVNAKGQCFKQDTTGCATHTGITASEACPKTSTTSSCKDTYGIVGTSASTTTKCAACMANCNRCDTESGKCDTCASTYVLRSDKTACGKCASNCSVCSTNGFDKCDTCGDGFIINTTTKQCDACAANCKTCTSAGKCETACNDGYIKKSDSTGCDACAANCKTCTSAGKCETACNAGYIKKTDSTGCDACADNCAICSTAGLCESDCKDAWGRSGESKIQTLCFACPSNCATCTSDNRGTTTCTKCKADYYLDATKSCQPAGYGTGFKCLQADGTSCTRCSYGSNLVAANSGCQECIADKKCQKTCSGSTVITPGGASNSTTTTDDSSSSNIVMNVVLFALIAVLANLII